MGKKTSNIAPFKKGKFTKNNISVKKSKILNNKYKQLQFKKRLKKFKNKEYYNNSSFKKRKQKTNHYYNKSNDLNDIGFNNNPFIFNSLFDNKKQNERPEWMSQATQKIENIDTRFNKEIMEYVDYIIPKNISLSQRQSTRQRLTNIIKKYKPDWQIILFGSFSQNTSTVFSDLDFSVMSSVDSSRKMDINELIYIMKILRNEGFSRNIRLIRARVPILKATCSLTGISVDISVNRDNGYKAAKIIRKILLKHKLLKPSIIILKILLKKNNLNDAHTGGMSSFLLFHLVYFFYLTYQTRIQNGIYNNTIEIEQNQNNASENNSNNNTTKEDKEYNENEYEDEQSEISYDSNSEFKSSNKNQIQNGHGIIISKAISSSDEEDNSNDDSNIIKNGSSSDSNSEEEKSPENNSNYENRNKNFNKDKEYEDSVDDVDNSNEDYFNKICDKKEEEEKNNEESNLNIGHFIFLFLKFYSLEFDYHQLGFSLNENNFGATFFKVERIDMDCSDNICAESIQDQGVDVGRTCYNYPKIVNLFKNAYKKIKIEKQRNTCSILQSLGFPTI